MNNDLSPTQPTKVLMVCLGNICRSPLAQGILEHKVGDDYFVDSAGTAAYHIGNSPDRRSVAIAKDHGIDISNQKARQFKSSDFDKFDIIFAMDDSNYRDILSLARNQQDKQKVQMILNELYPKENRSVPDPYYGGIDGFQQVYNLLDNATDAFLKNRTPKNAKG